MYIWQGFKQDFINSWGGDTFLGARVNKGVKRF